MWCDILCYRNVSTQIEPGMFCAGRDVGVPILPVPTDFSTVIERVNIHDKQVTYETVSVYRTMNQILTVTGVLCCFLFL